MTRSVHNVGDALGIACVRVCQKSVKHLNTGGEEGPAPIGP
jgi:hypothetical protein